MLLKKTVRGRFENMNDVFHRVQDVTYLFVGSLLD